MKEAHMQNKVILVAGGAGFIGSHTAKALRQSGYEPVVFDNLSMGNRFALRYGDFVEGEIADRNLLGKLLVERKVEGAILFAANAYVGESTLHPAKYYQNNIAASLNFLDALREAGVSRLVFSSSCSIYGMKGGEGLIAEDCGKDPLSPYAETKLFLEQVLRWYESAYGLQSACLRYFNAAGADPDGEIGESHRPETHLVPLAIYAAMGGNELRIFGEDYPTPDGTAIRDYIHVSDLARAHVLALGKLFGGSGSFAVNLGTGQGSSVREVVAMVEKVSGRTVPARYEPRRLGDAPSLVADASRARQLLGWSPALSSLESIVTTAWRWHSELEPRR
jgi:UDP-arabinose 4-epimerase